ncbi:MAG: TIGR02391 family protein [Phycisphaerales bacterium JB054]
MSDSPFEMRFDPQTIKHLGVRMYSTLPPALAEIISNAYDADADSVLIHLVEHDQHPTSITIKDDGHGLGFDDINSKFLVIGRNRRRDQGDLPSPKHKRLPTGKKGLGKLALFGLASTIVIRTVSQRKLNEFVLDWDALVAAQGAYRPQAIVLNQDVDERDGTTLTLTGLKRTTPFDVEALADSLSRYFLFDDTFKVVIESSTGARTSVDNRRKYRTLDTEFSWSLESDRLLPPSSPYHGQMRGELYTSTKPIAPASGLRGITLFSRGKLVNSPEFFSASTSSHFYQYLTGWITVDFIEAIGEDVIATNRQSLDWQQPEMAQLRKFLTGLVSQISGEWRTKRKTRKKKELEELTGIDTDKWTGTMPADIRERTQRIIDALGGEDALEGYTPIIKELHALVPEYPLLHWRHLHTRLQERVRVYYENNQFGDAASQGVQIYCERIRQLTGLTTDGQDLVNRVFGSRPFSNPPPLQLNSLGTDSEQCIQEGQGHLSRGVITGFRNPLSHDPIDAVVPTVFSELDCLNILSLVSYLLARIDSATTNP